MDDQTEPKDPLPGKTRPDKRHPARLPPSDHMSGHRARMRAKVMEKGADIDMTAELKAALALVTVTLHDHLIVAGQDVVSFKSLGLL